MIHNMHTALVLTCFSHYLPDKVLALHDWQQYKIPVQLFIHIHPCVTNANSGKENQVINSPVRVGLAYLPACLPASLPVSLSVCDTINKQPWG